MMATLVDNGAGGADPQPRQDLDRLGKLTVTRDPSVLVPIGADQVSQDLRIPPV